MSSYQLISDMLVSKMLRNIEHQAHILIVHKFGLNWNLSALLRKAWTTELNMNLFHKVICWTLYFRQMVGVHLAPHPIWLQWSCHTLSLKSFPKHLEGKKIWWKYKQFNQLKHLHPAVSQQFRAEVVGGTDFYSDAIWAQRSSWGQICQALPPAPIAGPLKLLTASKHLKKLVIQDFSSCFCFYQLTSFPKSKLVSIGKEDSMENGGHYVIPDVEEGEQAHDAPMLWNRINTWKYSAWNYFISS